VPRSGSYRILARAWGRDLWSDSFWVSVDGRPEWFWGIGGELPRGQWVEELVHHWDGQTNHVVQVTLTAGTHTVRFRTREAGARLDWVRMVTAQG
jgi:hypothetical protein